MQRRKTRRLIPPTEEQIKKGLAACKNDSLPDVVDRALLTREVDLLLNAASELSVEDPSFRVSLGLLERLTPEFSLLGVATVCDYASKWLAIVANNHSSSRNAVVLLSRLVSSVDLLRNAKLRGLLKSEVPRLHDGLLRGGYCGLAASLLRCLFVALVVESSYADFFDSHTVDSTWDALLEAKASQRSAYTLLCSFLLREHIGRTSSDVLGVLADCDDQLTNIDETPDDELVCLRSQFFSLLQGELCAIATRCEPSKCLPLVRALVNFHCERRSLGWLARSITQQSANPRRDVLTSHFCSSLLQQIAFCLDDDSSSKETSSRQGANSISGFSIWMSKLSELMIVEDDDDFSSVAFITKNENAWASVMRRFMGHVAVQRPWKRLASPGERVEDCVALLAAREVPFEHFPMHTRSALLGAVLQLLVVMPFRCFDGLLEAFAKLFNSDCAYFRSLFARVGNSASEPLLKFILPGLSPSNAAFMETLLAEYFLSSSGATMLQEKTKFFLENSGDDQSIALRALCDALYRGLSFEVNDDLKNFIVSEVFPNVWKSASHIADLNTKELGVSEMESLFSILKPLRQVQSIAKRFQYDSPSENDLSVIAHVCLEMCVQSQKWSVTSTEESAASCARLLGIAAEFVSERRWTRRLMKWKCLAGIAAVDVCIVEKILLGCTVNDLERLMTSRLPSSVGRPVLLVARAAASLQNERKRALLLAVLDELLCIAGGVPAGDSLDALRLLRALLRLVSGSPRERSVVSFTLGFLSVSFSFLGAPSSAVLADFDSLYEVELTLLDCLRHCSASVTNDECALFAQIYARTACAVHSVARAVPDGATSVTPRGKAASVPRLAHQLACIAHAICDHRTSFARIAPFVVSDVVQGSEQCPLAMHRLLSLCDRYSVALLGAALPAVRKRHFTAFFPQYSRAAEFTV